MKGTTGLFTTQQYILTTISYQYEKNSLHIHNDINM